MCSQDGWLELDAYYTGANRGKDPSDLDALDSKPNEALLVSDSAIDLTQPQTRRGAFKAVTGRALDHKIKRCDTDVSGRAGPMQSA
jgi:hypothetical protein